MRACVCVCVHIIIRKPNGGGQTGRTSRARVSWAAGCTRMATAAECQVHVAPRTR